jgi:hypothetical protein
MNQILAAKPIKKTEAEKQDAWVIQRVQGTH